MLLQRIYHVINYNRILQRVVLYKNIYLASKKKNNIQAIEKLWLTFTIMGTLRITKEKDNDKKEATVEEASIAKADILFNQENYKDIYDLLSNYKDSKNVEILWRLCRTIYKMSETASDIEARKLIYEGYDLICLALDIQENHYAVHKWMAVLLNSKSSLEGTREQVKQMYNIKKHLLRSLELNPNDATTLYMLGRWCNEIANLAWYQQKISSIIFGEIPTTSYEEALMYYEKAEEVEPNFYCHNLLMLGKMYLKLNRKEDAIKYLKKAAEFPVRNDNDHKTKQEAQKILNSI